MKIAGKRFVDSIQLFFLLAFVLLFGPYRRQRRIAIGKKRYTAYIADNFFSRAFGYMFREKDDLKRNEAMLFIFSSPRTVSFTMSNVNFPIRILALTKDCKVIDSALMEPKQNHKTTLTGTLFLEIPKN